MVLDAVSTKDRPGFADSSNGHGLMLIILGQDWLTRSSPFLKVERFQPSFIYYMRYCMFACISFE